MASLMAESLDVAMENFLKPTKYDKLTSLSKTLRDDPSCQLCTILVKYMMKLDMSADIEANLDDKCVPPLTILRQGISYLRFYTIRDLAELLCSLVRKLVLKSNLQHLNFFKLRHVSDQKTVSVAKRQSLLVRN